MFQSDLINEVQASEVTIRTTSDLKRISMRTGLNSRLRELEVLAQHRETSTANAVVLEGRPLSWAEVKSINL